MEAVRIHTLLVGILEYCLGVSNEVKYMSTPRPCNSPPRYKAGINKCKWIQKVLRKTVCSGFSPENPKLETTKYLSTCKWNKHITVYSLQGNFIEQKRKTNY